MSVFIKFYFTSSMLNMFRSLIHPLSRACNFFVVSPHWLCVLVSMCIGVSVWLVGVVSVWQASASKNKFEKLVHLVGFIIRIYHDARSPERQIRNTTLLTMIRAKDSGNIADDT